MIANRNGTESCGICGDTGFAQLNNGDAVVCGYCEWGATKRAMYPWVRHTYAVNDVEPVHTRGQPIYLGEYAKTERGKRDEHLDRARQTLMRMRKAAKK